MSQAAWGLTNKSLSCDICKISFSTEADHALHEFSKKHCNNLLKISRNKEVILKKNSDKQKISEIKSVQRKFPKPNINTQTVSIAKYGYFVPGEVHSSLHPQSNYFAESDVYLQKFNENLRTLNEVSVVYYPTVISDNSTNLNSLYGTSKQNKRNKIKICQLCEVTCLTVAEHNAHMKSSQHIWKLKSSGMGVSAHFVKAETDLHTTESGESVKPEVKNSCKVNLVNEIISNYAALYCNKCKISFGSIEKMNNHMKENTHLELRRKKAKSKLKKNELNVPNQLYCFSCKKILNNIIQYNEHKSGKKHKIRCMQLMKKGITIPPEDRFPDWVLPSVDTKEPVVFLDLYESSPKETTKEKSEHENKSCYKNLPSNLMKAEKVEINTTSKSDYKGHCNSASSSSVENSTSAHQASQYTINGSCEMKNETKTNENSETTKIPNSGGMGNLMVLSEEEFLSCQICLENFMFQSRLDNHFAGENHLKNIWQKKQSGLSNSEILNMLLTDRNKIKPDEKGKWKCFVCHDVILDKMEDFMRHVNSNFHERNESNYIQRKRAEINFITGPNDRGLYWCEYCSKGFESLAEFCHHLPSIDHPEKENEVLGKRTSDFFLTNIHKNDSKCKKIVQEKTQDIKSSNSGVKTSSKQQIEISSNTSMSGNVQMRVKGHLPTDNCNEYSEQLTSSPSKRTDLPSLMSVPIQPPYQRLCRPQYNSSEKPSRHPFRFRRLTKSDQWCPKGGSYLSYHYGNYRRKKPMPG